MESTEHAGLDVGLAFGEFQIASVVCFSQYGAQELHLRSSSHVLSI